MNQPALFEFAERGMKAQVAVNNTIAKFDGQTFEEKLDGPRLRKQLERVREYMLAIYPTWKTLEEISEDLEKIYKIKYPTQSISARLRDLKKEKFGNYEVPKKRREIGEFIESRSSGIWEYIVFSEKKV